ncbi:methyl-accepting chemotaxis protein [Paenibacillus sp. y28]|uniref:methyl-accepting chemotaxis protein n=1 Tax=Paenibacillus sp. y28 TaxID=3129110 RepID=UPI0030177C08
MSNRLQLSIQTKLLSTSLLILLIPIIILGSVSYDVSSTVSDSLIEKDLRNAVQLSIELIQSLDDSVKAGSITLEEAQEKVKALMLGAKQDGKRPINSNIDLGVNGYFYVMDTQGKLLAHPLLEGETIWDKQTSDGFFYIQDLVGKAKQGGGFTTYMWPLPDSTAEAKKIVYADLDSRWNWVVAAGSYMQDYNEGQRQIFKTILVTLASCVVIGGALLILFARHISKPLVRLEHQAERISGGDLTMEDLRVPNRDEIGRLAASFNEMKRHLRELVSQASDSSDVVSAASGQLSQSLADMTQAADSITLAVQDVAKGTDTHAQSVLESARAMEELSAGIQHVATSSSDAFDLSEDAVRHSEQGNEHIQQTTAQMNAVRLTMNDLSGTVKLLEERSREIGDIISMIHEISNQTNLLALNASIEAARAGEQGKGFAVVASEVKKLAERSKHSAEQVTGLIGAIQADITRAVAAMEQGDREVEQGMDTLQVTGEAFRQIHTSVKQVLNQVQEASAVAQQMAATSQQIMASLNEMEHSAHMSASSVQTVSASTEEQLASISGIAGSASLLGTMAERLRQVIHKFKV